MDAAELSADKVALDDEAVPSPKIPALIIPPEHKLVANVVEIVPPAFMMGINTVLVAVPEQPEAGVAVTLNIVSEAMPVIVKVAIPVLLFFIAWVDP